MRLRRLEWIFVAAWCAACGSFGSGDDPSPGTNPDAGANESGANGADAADATDAVSPPVDGSVPDSKTDGGSACPMGLGPTMRIIELLGGRSICVDVTEVTSGQYSAFRNAITDTAPLAAKVPTACSFVAAAALSDADATPSELPRVNVTFCSAAFFCAAQGKRICGSAGDGGAVVFSEGETEPVNEWELACANGLAANYYPWGTTTPGSAAGAGCVVAEANPAPTGPRAVGAAKQCGPSGSAGPFDMIGNVWEWVNVREENDSGSYTGLRGGAYDGNTVGNGCGTTHGADGPREGYALGGEKIGFRCCAETL